MPLTPLGELTALPGPKPPNWWERNIPSPRPQPPRSFYSFCVRTFRPQDSPFARTPAMFRWIGACGTFYTIMQLGIRKPYRHRLHCSAFSFYLLTYVLKRNLKLGRGLPPYQDIPLLPVRGLGSAIHSPRGVRGNALAIWRFRTFCRLTQPILASILLIINRFW